MQSVSSRKIIHVDQDAFYASVEQRDDPSLRGRPVAVGGSRARGVVAAASYEARRFGVRSAMPSVTAARLCPELVFVPPRFDVYRSVSAQIREIFLRYTDLVEPLSLDEAYLDVTEPKTDCGSATAIAEAIRAEIFATTGLTASAGISGNKFLAKLGSGMNKPNGMTVIRPDRGAEFVAELDVGRFHGIGPTTAARMHALGIRTGRDLRDASEDMLVSRFGKSGSHYRLIAWGIDDRPVVPDRERKSYGCEDTFEEDVWDGVELRAKLEEICDRVWEHRERIRRDGRTITLKAKWRDFEISSRSRTPGRLVSDRETLGANANGLLDQLLPLRMPLRLIGVSMSNLAGVDEVDPSTLQMSLI
jgi:DNA polymerase-4